MVEKNINKDIVYQIHERDVSGVNNGALPFRLSIMNFKTVQNESSEGMHAIHYTAGDKTEINSKTLSIQYIPNI